MKKMIAVAGAFGGLTLLCGGMMATVPRKAQAFTDTVVATVKQTCAMTPKTVAEHNISMEPGLYKADIGQTNLEVSCNGGNGWAIYAVGYGGNVLGATDLVNSSNSSYVIPTAAVVDGDASGWSMKVTAEKADAGTPVVEKGFDEYAPVPASYAKVAAIDGPVSKKLISSVAVTYAAYTIASQPSGVYNGAVKYTLVYPSTNPMPCMGGCTLAFNVGSGSGGPSAATQETERFFDLDTVAGTVPTRSGYDFVGWATAQDGPVVYKYLVDSEIYFPSLYEMSDESATLYAVWAD